MTINRRWVVAGGALTIPIALLYAFDPGATSAYPSCPFRSLTGLLCPLCGGLRAAHALLHGRVIDAVVLNPFLFVAGVLGPIVPLRWMVVAAALFTVLRNIA